MKIIIAPDSFKNALRNTEVAQALAEGWRRIRPADDVLQFPLSDGGEGFCLALQSSGKWERIVVDAHDPLMRPMKAEALISLDGETAALELAAASGLELLRRDELSPLAATTYGTGEILRQLLERGVHRIFMGIGGSATTDGGAGIFQALGGVLRNAAGEKIVVSGGGALPKVCSLDETPVRERLRGVQVIVACDVTNPLCGPRGSAAVFSPQKGASTEDVACLEQALRHWGVLWKDDGRFAGAGAAGGVGFLLRMLGAELVPGASAMIRATGLDEALKGADWLLTGEGRSDAQTLDGKLCAVVAQMARKCGVRTALLSGAIVDTAALAASFDDMVVISKNEPTLQAALANTARNLADAAAEMARRLTAPGR